MSEWSVERFAAELDSLLVEAGLESLQDKQNKQLSDYLSLILRWNTRMNLTAARENETILSRHIVESIACAQRLPTPIATLLDLGSGAGFPGVPIAVCRPEIAVTLAESQGKKAAFLHEAVRVLELTATVHSGRAEELSSRFDCVTLRAVDRMESAIQVAAAHVRPGGWLVPMTTTADLAKVQSAAGSRFNWLESKLLPGSRERIAAIGILIEDLN